MKLNHANRDDRIRTCGPFVPNEVRYQAALHPVEAIVEDRPLMGRGSGGSGTLATSRVKH